MKRREILRAAALTPLSLGWLGRAGAADPENAVDLYREAIRALPDRTDADREAIDIATTSPIGGRAGAFLSRSTEALDLLTLGASAPICDWGDTWTVDGFEAWFPLFGPVRDLARLAVLRTRRDAESGHADRGMIASFAAITLGRHLIQGGVLIAQLVGMAIEHVAIAGASVALPALDGRGLAEADRRLLSLPAIPDLAATVRAEKAFFLGYLVPHDRDTYDDARVARVSAWFDRIIDACATPGVLPTLRDGVDPDDAQLLDSLAAYRQGRTFSEVKRALFRAAIAVAADGPGALAAVPDPTDGRPFDLRSWAFGFELTSRFTNHMGVKANLIVGRR